MENLENKLIADNWITQERLERARQEAAHTRKSVWAMLIKLGFISWDNLCIFFAQESGVPYVQISDYKINPETLRILDEDFCRQNVVIPLFKIKETVSIACSNPLDTELLNNILKCVPFNVELLLAPSASILNALDTFYGPRENAFELEKLIIQQGPLKGLAFWRESERLSLAIPVSMKIEDSALALSYTLPIDGWTRDISHNGTAIGLEVFLYLPKRINVSLEFKPEHTLLSSGKTIKTKGEIVYCRMEKGQHYFLGIKFTEISAQARDELFRLAA